MSLIQSPTHSNIKLCNSTTRESIIPNNKLAEIHIKWFYGFLILVYTQILHNSATKTWMRLYEARSNTTPAPF